MPQKCRFPFRGVVLYQVTHALPSSTLRQTMIRKLSKVGKDKETWKKAQEYLTQLQDDDHMLTLEDTNLAIKRDSTCTEATEQTQ